MISVGHCLRISHGSHPLANLGEFIGGVAVLVTLIYLAIQVRSTRAQIQYRGSTDLVERIYQAYAPVYEGRNAEIL